MGCWEFAKSIEVIGAGVIWPGKGKKERTTWLILL